MKRVEFDWPKDVARVAVDLRRPRSQRYHVALYKPSHMGTQVWGQGSTFPVALKRAREWAKQLWPDSPDQE